MTADTVGGVWTHALALAGALSRWPVEIRLATMGAPPTDEQRAAAAALPHVALIPSGFRLEWMDAPWDDVRRAGDWLLGLAESWRPDLVHLNGYAHGALPWRRPVLVAGHSCVLSWWRAVKGEEAPPEWAPYREAVARGLAASDLVVAPSRAMLAALAELYGVPRRGTVVPNGLPPAPPARCAKEAFVLSAGRLWDEAKNVAAIDRASARLSWPVFVAGETAHPSGGEVRLRHARPLGRLAAPEMAGWQRRAAIFALPVRYEPFGLSALEAARAGCALVLGDIPSQREVWDDAALFVPPDDADALAGAIEGLIRDPARRMEMAARARRRASRFTAYRMARSYLALYRRLAARGAAAEREAA
jgi:glycosyltransferase involved in cell wall biosynthesis